MSMKTGAIDNGVARIAKRFAGRGAVVIAILMILFLVDLFVCHSSQAGGGGSTMPSEGPAGWDFRPSSGTR